MKKTTFILSLVLIFVSLYSINDSRNIFDKPVNTWYINPGSNSANQLSMGGISGVANIWDSSPL